MSSHNLRILTRNLRKEEEKRILYKNRASSWKTIFKHHPLESSKNVPIFEDMIHCVEHWGGKDDPIVILRSAYTWDKLLDISKNSLQDCLTFYEVAKNTIIYKKGILDESSNKWFKRALTSIYLSKSNVPDSLNFLSELNHEHKEKVLSIAFQFFGVDALPQYEKLKNEFNLQNFYEKLIFWYWDVSPKEKNLIDNVIEKVGEKNIINYDLEYIADKIKPKNLFKYQSEEINKRFIPFSNIMVKTERYVVQHEKMYCVINTEKEITTLENIYNLLSCQYLIKLLEPKPIKYPKVGDINKEDSFLDVSKFNSNIDIFNSYPLIEESKISMESFIELNKSKNDNQNYWNEVQSVFLSKVLAFDLDNKNNTTKKLKI